MQGIACSNKPLPAALRLFRHSERIRNEPGIEKGKFLNVIADGLAPARSILCLPHGAPVNGQDCVTHARDSPAGTSSPREGGFKKSVLFKWGSSAEVEPCPGIGSDSSPRFGARFWTVFSGSSDASPWVGARHVAGKRDKKSDPLTQTCWVLSESDLSNAKSFRGTSTSGLICRAPAAGVITPLVAQRNAERGKGRTHAHSEQSL